MDWLVFWVAGLITGGRPPKALGGGGLIGGGVACRGPGGGVEEVSSALETVEAIEEDPAEAIEEFSSTAETIEEVSLAAKSLAEVLAEAIEKVSSAAERIKEVSWETEAVAAVPAEAIKETLSTVEAIEEASSAAVAGTAVPTEAIKEASLASEEIEEASSTAKAIKEGSSAPKLFAEIRTAWIEKTSSAAEALEGVPAAVDLLSEVSTFEVWDPSTALEVCGSANPGGGGDFAPPVQVHSIACLPTGLQLLLKNSCKLSINFFCDKQVPLELIAFLQRIRMGPVFLKSCQHSDCDEFETHITGISATLIGNCLINKEKQYLPDPLIISGLISNNSSGRQIALKDDILNQVIIVNVNLQKLMNEKLGSMEPRFKTRTTMIYFGGLPAKLMVQHHLYRELIWEYNMNVHTSRLSGGAVKMPRIANWSPKADFHGELIRSLTFVRRVSSTELGAALVNKERNEDQDGVTQEKNPFGDTSFNSPTCSFLFSNQNLSQNPKLGINVRAVEGSTSKVHSKTSEGLPPEENTQSHKVISHDHIRLMDNTNDRRPHLTPEHGSFRLLKLSLEAAKRERKSKCPNLNVHTKTSEDVSFGVLPGGSAQPLTYDNVRQEAEFHGEAFSSLKFAQRVPAVEFCASRVNNESTDAFEGLVATNSPLSSAQNMTNELADGQHKFVLAAGSSKDLNNEAMQLSNGGVGCTEMLDKSHEQDPVPVRRVSRALMKQIEALNMKARRIAAQKVAAQVGCDENGKCTEVASGRDGSSGITSYDAQSAKMKERARQRASELKEEEEERKRTQKARAMVKLEELNMRQNNRRVPDQSKEQQVHHSYVKNIINKENLIDACDQRGRVYGSQLSETIFSQSRRGIDIDRKLPMFDARSHRMPSGKPSVGVLKSQNTLSNHVIKRSELVTGSMPPRSSIQWIEKSYGEKAVGQTPRTRTAWVEKTMVDREEKESVTAKTVWIEKRRNL